MGKPTLVVDEFLGGSGAFLTSYSQICSRKIPAAAVSTTRIEDKVQLTDISKCVKRFRESDFLIVGRGTAGQERDFLGAKAVGTLDSEYGCRTKLIGEVMGDIGKLFDQWDKFGWHRVTVYGDVKEPLAEFGKALGLKVIQEA